MRKFIERALKKLPKLDQERIHKLIFDLASENERFEVVLDSMSDGVIVSDVEHNLIFYNKAAERLLPLQGDAHERPMWAVVDDEEVAEFIKDTLLNQETVVDREFTLGRKGLARILSCSITPLVRDGEIQGNILHIDEITEKRAKEARLRRAESLASLTTLAAGVAHEIKNPLGSIGIHIQLIQKLLRGQEGVEVDRIESYIDVVNEEVDRLNKIVVDFLFAVRPMDVNLESADLNHIVGDLLDFIRYELEQNNIDLIADLDEGLPRLELDEKYLKQALMNIVKNAISAMPNGGTLRVTTLLRGDSVLLQMSDSGVGMSEEVSEKIFEPYFTTKDFGSGIGLTLVYKVVKEHKGEISVASQKGKGTTFTITLPVPQTEQPLLSYSAEEA